MDLAPQLPVEFRLSSAGVDSGAQPAAALAPVNRVADLSGVAIDEFWREAGADRVGLEKDEFARALLVIGARYNYGFAPGVQATRSQIAGFWHALQLPELALAQACALGRDIAWQRFLADYREPLTQAAIGIAGSAALGKELADSLYSEIFGLRERDGQRQSPLAAYSGRGSLKGFLRATLAQRNVDRLRRTRNETSLTGEDWAAPATESAPAPDLLRCLCAALTVTLGALDAEERFLLAAWFLDGHTLFAIARILGVHEATVSRRIQRLTLKVRKDLLKNLRTSGMSRAAAEEALGIDTRYVDLNLRRILQASRPGAFLSVNGLAETDHT